MARKSPAATSIAPSFPHHGLISRTISVFRPAFRISMIFARRMKRVPRNRMQRESAAANKSPANIPVNPMLYRICAVLINSIPNSFQIIQDAGTASKSPPKMYFTTTAASSSNNCRARSFFCAPSASMTPNSLLFLRKNRLLPYKVKIRQPITTTPNISHISFRVSPPGGRNPWMDGEKYMIVKEDTNSTDSRMQTPSIRYCS